MASHADTLDQPERLSKPFRNSLILHISVAVAVLAYGWIQNWSMVKWGDPNGGGGIGSVAVNAVASIKLPSRDAPPNPVANDTQSHVPEAPAQKKVAAKVKAPDPDAIAIKSKSAPKREPDRVSSAPNKWREQQKDAPNQLYSTSGQSASDRRYNMEGGGGPKIGNDSPFGTQFGAYAKIVQDSVARKWNTSDFDSRLTVPTAVVTFVIHRDGSLGSVQISERSGNAALDISAQRAVMDAAPFPQLPPGFSKNEAKVELRFNLK